MIRKAMVLAAGKGTRMGALTQTLPKPMLTVAGRPMLEHIVRRLQHAGMVEILIVTGYHHELIEDHFRTGFTGLFFVVQQVPEGTASAVKLGRDFAAEEPFLLTFGDIITPSGNYRGICERQEAGHAAAVVGVKRVEDPWQGAAVYVDPTGVVTRIIEKPDKGTSTTHWNSAGLYAFSPEVFKEIDTVPKSPRGEYEITSAVAQLIAHDGSVRMFEMQGAWRDVGRPEDLSPAAEDFAASPE